MLQQVARVVGEDVPLVGRRGEGMEESAKNKPERKPYQAPEVVKIALRPEEAILGSCLVSASAGPFGSSCVTALGKCRGS